MMKKIGLVSYHFWYNFGTCLQALALQQVIEDFGYKCEYLNFGQWRYPGGFPTPTIKDEIKRIAKWILRPCNTYRNKKNKAAFNKFRLKYIKESIEFIPKYNDSILSQYYKIIVGSDQTWNPICVSEMCFRNMLLDFIPNEIPKYSYASSLGLTSFTEGQSNDYKKYLNAFKSISVREGTSVQYLHQLLNREIDLVADPTLLLNKERWEKLIEASKHPNCNYVFCYVIGQRKEIVEFALRKAAELNVRLLIFGNVNHKLYPSAGTIIGYDPLDIVATINNAECVVTDSFHGSIFSANLGIPFYAFYKHNGGREAADNIRIFDILKIIGKCHCIVDEDKIYEDNNRLDNDSLIYFREQSLNYLRKILS